MNIKRVIQAALLGLLLAMGLWHNAGAVNIDAGQNRHVLLLNSYHIGHRWSDDVTQGILQVILQKDGDETHLSVEYMDTMRFPGQSHLDMLAAVYREKFRLWPVNLVIACDNNALDFVLARRQTLFSGVPVVFCGINNFQPALIAGQKNITGINQYLEVQGTIRLALAAQPHLRKLLVINDETTTGQANQALFEQARGLFEDRLSFEVVRQVTPELLFEKLENLGPDEAVLLFKYHYDSAGQFYSEPEFVRMIRDHCNRPIYSFQEQFLAFGITGGAVLSGRLHGQAAARLAVRILQGESADAIPVQDKGPVVETLEYHQMIRFKLDQSRLPRTCHILNQPLSTYEHYRQWIWAAFWVILILTAYIVALTMLFRNQSRTRKALQHSEAQLRRERDILHRIMESSPNGITLIDRTGLIIFANAQAQTLLGMLPGDGGPLHIDAPSWEVVDLDGQPLPQEQRAFYQTLRTGQRQYNLRYGVRRRDGSQVLLSFNTAPLRDESGQIDSVLSLFEDITAQIAAARERDLLIARLEQKNQEMEQYIYTFSHDLRSPLVSIGGYLGLMQQDGAQGNYAEFERYFEVINKAVGQMYRLLDDLLELSRIGRLINAPEDVDFGELAEEAIALVQGRFKGRQVEFVVQESLPKLLCDRIRFVEIFQNLIGNAVKYMGSQTAPRIEIGCETRPGHYRFWVRDNGMGIQKSYQKKIFNLFEKLDRSSEGSGMGLAIVKRIVELHGGAIWVESPGPDQGSTFYFTLPLPFPPKPL